VKLHNPTADKNTKKRVARKGMEMSWFSLSLDWLIECGGDVLTFFLSSISRTDAK
jgi:hypothetical protein